MSDTDHAKSNAKAWLETIADLATRMASDDSEVSEAAREEASESALSVMVRDGWRTPGEMQGRDEPEEFEVLLTTGGPALRIFGRLDRYNQPDRDHTALQYQDWGTPWTDYPLSSEDDDHVATFLSTFWFGE